MPEHSNKRKKFHDRDKYYRLAKEQGLRSRAAFKLVQINRKFHFLEKARVVLDLCAAPGGWTQIASRTMASAAGRSGSAGGKGRGNNKEDCGGHIIVAVDILPIRYIGQNVITLVGDITTNECHAKIKQTLSGAAVDVVLCDGAPNVGANYDRDAYAQNDIALMSLKCATHHLKRHGTFVTKLYRSRDYNSYLWVARQLFGEVKAVKPVSSRAQSAEIFLVCLDYKKPDKIDPKLLDSRCVFEQLYDEDGREIDPANGSKVGGKSGITVFHKQWESQSKGRRRQGYDMTNLDFTMRNIGTVAEFINSPDPIQMLTDCTGFTFVCGETCSNYEQKTTDEEKKNNSAKCPCQVYLQHPKTTSDIKECVADLKVLNKSDFKNLINWRLKMQVVRDNFVKQHAKEQGSGDAFSSSDDDSDDDDDNSTSKKKKDEEDSDDSEKEEERIQKEISELKEHKLKQKKKLKKKERELLAKRRKRSALGMDLNVVDVPEHDQIFTLATIGSKGELEAVREIDLDKVPTKLMEGDEEDIKQEKALDELLKLDAKELSKLRNQPTHFHDDGSDDDEEGNGKIKDVDPDTGYSYRLEREMDEAYHLYLSKTKNKAATSGTRMEKRQKMSRKKQMVKEAEEDEALVEKASSSMNLIDDETKRYATMLQGTNRDSDDSDDDEDDQNSDDDDDGFHAEPKTPEEHHAKKKAKNKKEASETEFDETEPYEEGQQMAENEDEQDDSGKNPLLFQLPDNETTSAKTARWFSNPLFQTIGVAAHAASSSATRTSTNSATNKKIDEVPADEKEDKDEVSSPVDPEELIQNWPKTDKQVRHEKRLKALARKERRDARRQKGINGELSGIDGFEVVASANSSTRRTGVAADSDSDDSDDDGMRDMDEATKAKVLEARKLIKAGMGEAVSSKKGQDSKKGFDVVPATPTSTAEALGLTVHDKRNESDDDNYDSDDQARTLALGTMMLRRSKAKALVDASYNRYAWNDPEDLPDWFVDDEQRHYRPQLPIPQELIDKMKARYIALSTKPIQKVAEARARKNKRAKNKLAAAKKKAEAVAQNPDMSEAMKLKAISKAMRSGESKKNAAQKVVVAKKNGINKPAGKGSKMVDKRQKSDARGMKRAADRKAGKSRKKRRR